MIRKSISLAFAMALAVGGQPALADWQCLPAGAKVPAAAQAASDYLERAERVYPTQVLGVLRTGDRVYLVNARDDGWSERVRLGLMELRLAEPDITAARRFQATLSGGPAPEASGIPAGEFVCLARERAARQGLAFRGEAVLLAAGKSVYLVDPIELAIAVEVRAIGGQALDLREVFAASARAGIYAGLFRGRAPSEPVVAVRPPEVAVTFPVGPIGRPDGVVVIMARAPVGDRLDDAVAAIGAADVPSVPAPATVLALPAPPVAEQPPARVAMADVPATPLSVKPLPQEIPAAAVVAVAEPAPVAAPAAKEARPVVVATPAPPVAEQPPARVAMADVTVAPPPAKPSPQEIPAAVVVAVAEPVRIAAPAAQGTQPIVMAAPAAPVAVELPARVVKADAPVAPPLAKPLPRVAPTAMVVAAAEPVLIVASVGAPAAQETRLVVLAAPVPPVAEEPPVIVAKADVPAAPPPVKPMPREAPTAVVVAAAGPVSIVATIGAPAAQRARPVAEQSYEDYAKTMKELMALRRSGAVRSISEMTYVHPAVEDLRAQRR